MQFLMSAASMMGVAIQSGDDGLTIAEVVANIPHDGAAIVVYALVIGSVALVWRAGRSRPPAAPGA